MIALTGATGQLGRLVIEHLLSSVPAASILAVVRNPTKAADLAARGIRVRQADYHDSPGLDRALAGVERLLLISGNEIGNRVPQHRNVIEAAQRQNVGFVVYTSLLHADRSPLSLASEHRQTEAMLAASGLPHGILRNGWYTENYTASIPAALQLGAIHGSAGDGRIASAPRNDYAEAAAKTLVGPPEPGRVFELAGDTAHTLTEFAAELSRQTGKDIPYRDLPEADYRAALLAAGLPELLAAGLANWDAGAAQGALFDDGHQLSRMLGRPTTPLADVVRAALATTA